MGRVSSSALVCVEGEKQEEAEKMEEWKQNWAGVGQALIRRKVVGAELQAGWEG